MSINSLPVDAHHKHLSLQGQMMMMIGQMLFTVGEIWPLMPTNAHAKGLAVWDLTALYNAHQEDMHVPLYFNVFYITWKMAQPGASSTHLYEISKLKRHNTPTISTLQFIQFSAKWL